jgi:hypothetical protein
VVGKKGLGVAMDANLEQSVANLGGRVGITANRTTEEEKPAGKKFLRGWTALIPLCQDPDWI